MGQKILKFFGTIFIAVGLVYIAQEVMERASRYDNEPAPAGVEDPRLDYPQNHEFQNYVDPRMQNDGEWGAEELRKRRDPYEWDVDQP